MYELLVLGLLMYMRMHGYLIAHIVNDMIGPWAKLSNGTLYPLLAKLEQHGFIVVSAPDDLAGARPTRASSKTFEITDAGRVHFERLMMDTTSNPSDYQGIFHSKVLFMEMLPVSQRRHLLDHYEVYCRAYILHLQKEAAEFPFIPNPPRILFWAANTMAMMATQWQTELAWLDELRPLLLGVPNETKEPDSQ